MLLAAAVLSASAAGGFLLHHLAVRHRQTLYPVPALSVAAPPPAPQPPSPVRRIPDWLPDITLPGPDGTAHRLTDWKGRPLVINFWATWCEPCRREIPLLKSLRRERSAQGLEIVGVALDMRDAVRQYAASSRIDYPLLVGEEGGLAAVSAFGMDTVLPFSVFVDRSGRVITLKVGELHRDEALFILDRVDEVDAGRVSLETARGQIAQAVQRLNALREASGG